VLTVGAGVKDVERQLRAGRLGCPDCGGALRPWGRARRRVVRGLRGQRFRLVPRRARCRSCGRTHVLLPATCLLRRADAVAVIGAALLAKAAGQGHRGIATALGRPAATVRGWLRRAAVVAGRVQTVLAGLAAGLGAEFEVPGPAGSVIADLVALAGAVAAAAARRLGPCEPWRLLAAVTGGRLLAPGGPDAYPVPGNTSCLWAAAA
jgi:uncharacterized protein DUF6431